LNATVQLRELPLGDALGRLRGDGLALRTGPVVFRARTALADVGRRIVALYADYPVCDESDLIDFDVAIVRPGGPRHWIKPQVSFEMDGQRPFNPLAGDQGFPLLEWGLNWCVYSGCHQYLVLHAAVVAREGRALILPAPSGSGKSTLCAALALSGWRLLSDELALIDGQGRLVPLPRPVSVKNQSIEVLSRHFPALRFGSRVEETVKGVVAHFAAPTDAVQRAAEPAWPAWVVLPRYAPGAPTTLSPLPRAQGFMSLIENAFNYDLFGGAGFERLGQVIDRCRCFEFEYSDLGQALQVFDALATTADAPAPEGAAA
jgi:HprK-related kinase A